MRAAFRRVVLETIASIIFMHSYSRRPLELTT
jgi:hypothetical protein